MSDNTTPMLPAENKPVPTIAQTDTPPTSWEAIFEHDRFKALAKRAKEAETKAAALEQAQAAADKAKADAEQARLIQQQEFQKLYETERARAEQLANDLTAQAQAAQRKDNLRALMDAARGLQPAWAPEAIAQLERFAETTVLDGTLDAKSIEAELQRIAKVHPYVIQPTRLDAGSPAQRRPLGVAKPQNSGRPLTL